MKRFVAGVVVGAAFGVAATLLAVRRRDVAEDDRPQNAREVATPGAVLSASGTSGPRRATQHAADAASEPPAAPSASAPPPKTIDIHTASLDELLAAIRGPVDESGKTAGGNSLTGICGEIARRFPDFRYPTDVIERLVRMPHDEGDRKAFDRAVSTWTDDVALAEFARLARAGGGADGGRVVYAIARTLRDRGHGLPSDVCADMLRDEDPAVRRIGIGLAEFATDVDVAGLRTAASDEPDPTFRVAALQAMRVVVFDQGRVKPDDVSETILAALRDPDATVHCAAQCALVAAGAKGAQTAFETLQRDGDFDETDGLVLAVVAAGRAAELLDARPFPTIACNVANSLAELSGKRPELLRDVSSRFVELRSAVAVNGNVDAFFVAALKVLGSRVVVESAVARDVDPWARVAALNALLDEPTTWHEAHALVRRIVADRGETTRMRLAAMDELDEAPEDHVDEVLEETTRFLADLLPVETNDRVRSEIAGRLAKR
jgi:hypothetical protein